MKLLRGLIVILAVFALVASASLQSFLAEQAELEAMESFGQIESPDVSLHTELDEEDRALSELGIDTTPLVMAESQAEVDVDVDAEVDVDVDSTANSDAELDSAATARATEALEEAAMEEASETGDYPALAIPVIRRGAIPIVSREEAIRSGPATEGRVFTIAGEKPPAPVVVVPVHARRIVHPPELQTVVTSTLANELLTRMYDVNPISPFEVADRLPRSAKIALLKVLRKTNDAEGQVTITASFLAPFAVVQSHEAEAEAQARAAALLEADSEAVAVANTEDHAAIIARQRSEFEDAFPDMPAIGMSALETETETEVDADAEVDVDADAEAEVDADAEAEVDAETEVSRTNSTIGVKKARVQGFDAGVGALRKYAEALEGEALVLSKKLEELGKLHQGSVFKAMDRGPVGRRPTPKERQQVFTNGMRAWEAEATSERLRKGGVVSATEADRIFSLEPSPK